MELGERIKALRLDLGINQSELAKRAGITKGYMSQIEAGNAPRPSGDVLFRISKVLGVTVADLLGQHIEPGEAEIPPSLREFADKEGLLRQDVEMLAKIKFRGQQPSHPNDWFLIYESIRRSFRGSN